MDIDIAAFTYNDAKYIRKEIQINNEDIYYLYIYINLYADNIKDLEYYLNKIEGIKTIQKIETEEEKKVEAAPVEEELTQMNIRIPVSLKRDIDKIVFEKKYAGEDVNIKSLVSQWIQESVKKELRKNG